MLGCRSSTKQKIRKCHRKGERKEIKHCTEEENGMIDRQIAVLWHSPTRFRKPQRNAKLPRRIFKQSDSKQAPRPTKWLHKGLKRIEVQNDVK